jgi:hypothetical protein
MVTALGIKHQPALAALFGLGGQMSSYQLL